MAQLRRVLACLAAVAITYATVSTVQSDRPTRPLDSKRSSTRNAPLATIALRIAAR